MSDVSPPDELPDATIDTAPDAVAPEPVAVEPPEPETPPEKPKQKPGDSWLETVKTIVYALLIALVIRTFLFQPFNIPSGSMKSTLLVGDYVFVEKFAYGYSKASVPYMLAPFSGRIFGSTPDRGDVVVFKMPNPNSPEYHWRTTSSAASACRATASR